MIRRKTPAPLPGNSRPCLLAEQRGVALVTMMLLLTALTMLALGAVVISSIDMQLAGNYYQNSRAFYAAGRESKKPSPISRACWTGRER